MDLNKLQQTVKVGPKGRHMKVPYGYKVVADGVCVDDDKFANGMTYTWSSVESDDIGMSFDSFDCLIRKMSFQERLDHLRKAMCQDIYRTPPPATNK